MRGVEGQIDEERARLRSAVMKSIAAFVKTSLQYPFVLDLPPVTLEGWGSK